MTTNRGGKGLLMDAITKMKAELYDCVLRQGQLQMEINKLQEVIMKKTGELDKLLKDEEFKKKLAEATSSSAVNSGQQQVQEQQEQKEQEDPE